MVGRKHRDILRKQKEARSKLWPELKENMLWSMDNDGWIAVPRLMPLMMSIMDDLSGKGYPVGQTYFELWSRLREEQFLTLNRPEEMAFHAGFEGQRALRTWKDRVQRLANLGFIGLKSGPLGDLSYAVFYNPYHVIKRAFHAGNVQERKWQALIVRANEISAFDIDDVDEAGNILPEESEEEEKPSAKAVPKAARSAPIKSRRVARAK